MNTIVDTNARVQHGEHKHQCPACATTWKHSDNYFGNVEAHSCPRCGTEQWDKLLDYESITVELDVIRAYRLLAGRGNAHEHELRLQLANQFYDEL